jgi:hypothetical protein
MDAPNGVELRLSGQDEPRNTVAEVRILAAEDPKVEG